MDWSNEPYVRLYTRDTTNWKRIGWDGQCVLMALLRKVDRAGALDLEGLEPWEAVKLHIDCPEEVARSGVAQLLRVKTLVVRGGLLVFPNHMAAQEATKSDRLRQKESRERRARGNEQTVTTRDAPSQNVTSSQRSVTPENDQSQPVTAGHSGLCSAEPGSAVRTRIARAREESPPANPVDRSDPEETEEPEGEDADRERPAHLVRKRFDERFLAAQAAPFSWGPKAIASCELVGAWLDQDVQSAREFQAKLKRLLDGFFADPWAQTAGYPISDLAERPARYFAPPKPVRDVRKGFVDPAPPSAFKNPTNLDKVFGPEPPAAGSKR